jgi:glycosyltransferase involved in cell wall biosynthesis
VTTSTLPRLLILSSAVPETRPAGAHLLYRMLRGYPPSHILSIGPRTHPQSELLPSPYRYLAPAPSARLDHTRLAALKRSFESLGLVGRIPLSRVRAAVGDYEPDVVLTVMERRDYVDAAHRYCKAHRLPLIVIVHDRLESFDMVYRPFAAAQVARNADTYRFASARLCVSPEMVAHLREVYGAEGTVLYPIRSEGLQPRPAELSGRLVAPPSLTIAYCGALSYGYGRRLREVAPAMVRAGARIRIYSRDTEADWPEGVIFAGGMPADQLWAQVKRDCDAVWLPYAHDAFHRKLYSTHFPSKLTEYAALGMPLLISGPAEATGVRWGLRQASAVVTLADETVRSLEEAVAELRQDHARRVALAAAVTQVGAEFDPDAIRRQFVGIVKSVHRS